ncbi:hypothetical protein BZL30_1966 [Mycobacterium kansasii]|uniref:Uncharacterized protein n=1 Tax=Mycobacterium kansasii TaxID=1768 RepID=A0A1V3XJ38_MYCKA|nr:hypothetical protein BZL30_1966 [Mycobacterium kansasii]
MVVFAVEPAVVGASAVSQAGLAAQHGAGVAGCAAALVGWCRWVRLLIRRRSLGWGGVCERRW